MENSNLESNEITDLQAMIFGPILLVSVFVLCVFVICHLKKLKRRNNFQALQSVRVNRSGRQI